MELLAFSMSRAVLLIYVCPHTSRIRRVAQLLWLLVAAATAVSIAVAPLH